MVSIRTVKDLLPKRINSIFSSLASLRSLSFEMSSSVRVLVLGAANGKLKELFAKISSLNTKAGPFDVVLCLGDVFDGEEDEYFQQLISGEVEILVSTYFTIGRKPLPESIKMLVGHGGQVCNNLYFLGTLLLIIVLMYLGRRGSFITAEGLKLMFLGGVEGDAPKDEYSPTFTHRDIAVLSGTADILITSTAPESISNLSSKPFLKGTQAIATLVQKIHPRYHFAAEGIFYEREPFDNGHGYTRFLSLGDVKGDRWYYAFKINVSAGYVEKPPQGVTGNPFKKREFEIDNRSCRICGDNDHLSMDCPQKQPRKRWRRIVGRNSSMLPFTDLANDCFFCLSNVNVAKHLVVSIGIEVYLALAKGPLTTKESTRLPFPGHLLIIPIAHTPFGSSTETSEMESYREKLTRFFEARNCYTVTFEIKYSGGIHAHWQLIAIPKDKSVEKEIMDGFTEKKMNLEKREPGESEEYCRLVLPSGSYVATLPVRFDLHFPRRILAKILNLKEREDWRSCIQSEDEERSDALAFRGEFESDPQSHGEE